MSGCNLRLNIAAHLVARYCFRLVGQLSEPFYQAKSWILLVMQRQQNETLSIGMNVSRTWRCVPQTHSSSILQYYPEIDCFELCNKAWSQVDLQTSGQCEIASAIMPALPGHVKSLRGISTGSLPLS